MIEVRIRHENAAKAVHLTETELDRLDPLMALLSAWGVIIDGEVYTNLTGQFVIDETEGAAFFEIIVNEDQL